METATTPPSCSAQSPSDAAAAIPTDLGNATTKNTYHTAGMDTAAPTLETGRHKKPVSAFMLFASEERKRLASNNESPYMSILDTTRLPSESNDANVASADPDAVSHHPGSKMTLGKLQKIIADRWKQLSSEDRQVWQDKAQEARVLYSELAAEQANQAKDDEQGYWDPRSSASWQAFPHSRVVRILKTDPELDKVSKDAVDMLNRSCVMFLQLLATKASLSRTLRKSSAATLINGDIVSAVHRQSRLGFLSDVLTCEDPAINDLSAAKTLRTTTDTVENECPQSQKESAPEKPSHKRGAPSLDRESNKRGRTAALAPTTPAITQFFRKM